jgi:hypothetical protein
VVRYRKNTRQDLERDRTGRMHFSGTTGAKAGAFAYGGAKAGAFAYGGAKAGAFAYGGAKAGAFAYVGAGCLPANTMPDRGREFRIG